MNNHVTNSRQGLRSQLLARAAAGALAIAGLAAAAPALAQGQPAAAPDAKPDRTTFDIPAQPLADALLAISRQANVNVMASEDLTRGRTAPAVSGTMKPQDAIRRVLAGSGLKWRTGADGAYLIEREAPGEFVAARGGRNRGSSYGEDAVPEGQEGIAEILVVGSRSQNVDIRRSENDAQPYVVFDSDEIERSHATNLEDFLSKRLSMNTQKAGAQERIGGGQDFDVFNRGLLNFRGLGSNETLVLVDGRRIAGVGAAGELYQGSISGIALNSIERIEVLPSTAGAIYGGTAVGGVINIILKRNYTGLQLRGNYGNTFDAVAGDLSLDLNGGVSFGDLRVNLSASHARTGTLAYSERLGLIEASRDLLAYNYGGMYPSSVAAPIGQTPNIRSVAVLDLAYFFATGMFRFASPNLTLRSTGESLGSPITFVPLGYAGAITDGGQALLSNAGKYNLAAPSQRSAFLRGTVTNSASLGLRYQPSQSVELYSDLLVGRTSSNYQEDYVIFGNVQGSDPRNPFNQTVTVTYLAPGLYSRVKNGIDNVRSNSGVIFRPFGDWAIGAEYAFGATRSRYEQVRPLSRSDLNDALVLGFADPAVAAFGPYTVSTDPQTKYGPNTSNVEVFSTRASGSIVSLPAGRLSVSSLLERRREELGYLLNKSDDDGASDPYFSAIRPQHQTILSAYTEIKVPIFSERNKTPLATSLELQASIRHDAYDLFAADATAASLVTRSNTAEQAKDAADQLPLTSSSFNSTDYLLAVRYKPNSGLMFRASYGSGFLPPSFRQITSRRLVGRASFVPAVDPKRGNSPLTGDSGGLLTTIQGGSPGLKPENSISKSVGLVLTPAFLRGFRLSVDYTDVKKDSEILGVSPQFVLDNEDALPGRVVRAEPGPLDPPGYPGTVILLDVSLLNSGGSRVKALDYQADYLFSVPGLGEFRLYGVASQTLSLERQNIPNGNFIEYVGFRDGPLKWRGNGGIDWTSGRFTAGWNMQYYGRYRVFDASSSNSSEQLLVEQQGSRYIPSQSYHDIYASYVFPLGGVLNEMKVSAGIQDVFGKRPPVLNPQAGTYSTYADPRLRRFTLGISAEF